MDPQKTDLPILYDQFCGPLFGTLILIHSQNGIFSDAISKHGNRYGEKLPLFSYGRDGHQPYSRGLYKDSLSKLGWPTPIEGVDHDLCNHPAYT